MSTHLSQSPPVAPLDNSIHGRLKQLRELQAELRAKPVKGSLSGIRRLGYKILHSTFNRLFTLNAATLDLIEKVYEEIESRPVQAQAIAAPSQQVAQAPQVAAPALVANNVFSAGETLASCGQTQDQAKLNNIRALGGFNSVYTSPAEMRMTERVVLYSLIFGIQPKNVLEIGTFRGGSTAIMCGAMDDTGFGQIACVDPMPKISTELWAQISHRCRMFEGPSPEILTEVSRQIKERFDFALIDANHTYDYVKRDIASVLPYLDDEAYILFHDANYPDVKRAIDESVDIYANLTDCGKLSIEPTVLFENGQRITWAGLRLLKFHRLVKQAKAA